MVYWQQNIFGLVAQEIIECVSKIVSSRYYSMMIVDLTLQDNSLITNGTGTVADRLVRALRSGKPA